MCFDHVQFQTEALPHEAGVSPFKSAISWEWADRNPALDLDKRGIREAPPRTRYLDHDEEDAVLQHAGAYLQPMIAFAIDTGLRLEEQLSLTLAQIDLRRDDTNGVNF